MELMPSEDFLDEELVAVITAAIGATMGTRIPNLNIKSIKRIRENKSAWEIISRQEQVVK